MRLRAIVLRVSHHNPCRLAADRLKEHMAPAGWKWVEAKLKLLQERQLAASHPDATSPEYLFWDKNVLRAG